MTSTRSFLFEELRRRQAKNPAYSLRAFAKSLGLPAGRVSQYLTGQRRITPAVASRIALRLGLSPEQENLLKEEKSSAEHSAYLALSEEIFRAIADWEHWAILSLIRIKGLNHGHRAIADRLGVPVATVDGAIQRLLQLDLIAKRRNRYYRTQEKIKTTDDISNRALRISHRQSLQQAMDSLDEVPVQWRDITSITMPVTTGKMAQAKEAIRKFRRSLCDLLEGENADEVYNLNIQLVPVTKIEGARP